MARNALEAVFGALGAGVRGYGRDAARRREDEQAEIERQDELARALAERQLRIFQSGLEESGPATQRAQNVGQFGQMAQAAQMATPAPMSVVGRALQNAGSAMETDIQRGRRVNIWGTEYVQPYSRTPQGIEERDSQRRAVDATAQRAQRLQDEQVLIQARGAEDRRNIRERSAITQTENLDERKRRAAAEFLQSAREGVTESDPSKPWMPPVKRPLTAQEREQLRESTYAAYGLNPDGSVLKVEAPRKEQEGNGGMDTLRSNRDAAIAAVNAGPYTEAQKRASISAINLQYAQDAAALRGRP